GTTTAAAPPASPRFPAPSATTPRRLRSRSSLRDATAAHAVASRSAVRSSRKMLPPGTRHGNFAAVRIEDAHPGTRDNAADARRATSGTLERLFHFCFACAGTREAQFVIITTRAGKIAAGCLIECRRQSRRQRQDVGIEFRAHTACRADVAEIGQ